jgi:hypothetical protein
MPDPVRISDLPAATALADADVLVIETAAGVVKQLPGSVVLRAENNLADLADAVAALEALGGMPATGGEFEGPVGFEIGTVAAAGTTQGTAAALTAQIVEVTTDGADKGVVLPAAVDAVGPIWVRGHDDNAHAVRLYPASGDSINGEAADAYITFSAGTGSMLVAMSSTRWAEWA